MNRPTAYPSAADEELVRLSRTGDSAAYDELVRRFRPGAVLMAQQILGCRSVAEDAAQDALVAALRSLHLLKDPARFPAWLCVIARNRALRMAEKHRQSAALPVDDCLAAHAADAIADPAAMLQRETDREFVRALVQELPDELADPVTLHYWHQWPVARIAQFYSLPLTTVKWRMHRGRQLLLKRLADTLKEEQDV